jgi:hypothetical protein
MTDRPPIRCGNVELRWKPKAPVGVSGAFVATVDIHMIYVWRSGDGSWRAALSVFGGLVGPRRGHATPEAAAADLAEFLKRLHEATKPWGGE